MSKFVGIKTYERFKSLWENNNINEFSLNFILDTGQLYTHGIFINSAVFGTAANDTVSLSIAGITNTLALSSHTHSNYYDKSENLDITNHKIVSGLNDLLFCSGGTLYLGNTDNPTYISGSTLYSTRGQKSYTILDTGNFEITNTLPSGYTFENTALIKYGSLSHQIDYVKRINTSQSFDYLHSYTQAGTNQLNGIYYGYINFTVDNIYNNPAWAQLRINISGKTIQYRTSADANNWIDLNSINVSLNSLNVAGIVPAPTITNPNKVWKTDNEGNPGWRDEKSYIFQGLTFQQMLGTNLATYDTTAARTILAGDNIAFSYENGIITLRALDTTYSDFVGASQSENGTAGLVIQPLAGDQNKYLRGDGSWLDITSLTASLMIGASNGTSTEAQSTNGNVHLIFKLGNSYRRYQIVGTGRTSVTSDSNGNITINSNPYSNFSAATSTTFGTAGLVPAPGINELGNAGYFLRADGTWLKPIDNDTWRSIYVDGILKLDTTIDTKPINFKAAGGITLTFINAGNNPTNTLEIKSTTYNNFIAATTQKAGESGLVPGPAINQFGSDGYYLRADGIWAIPTNTWDAANTDLAGYIPQLITGGSAISGLTTEYVLTYVSTETGVVTPKWKTLPSNAFKDTWNAASFTLAGYVPQSIKGKYLHANVDDGSLEWIDDRDTTYNTFIGASATDDGTSGLVTTPIAGDLSKFLKGNGTWDVPINTWRNIYVEGTQQMTTSNSSKGLNLVAGNNISLVYAAPGTSANQSGNNAYGNLTITAIDTWIAWQGASSQSNGTAGYMPAPTTALKDLFLRGDGQWVSLNNYSLPVATNSTLGGVKVGTTLDNEDGFTKVHIKDNYIYYKDTTYLFSNLKFLQTSGTDLMTYNSQAVRTILAGTGITFSHSNNILTISSATYSTATVSSLGLVKIGTTLEDTTGYTKVHIDKSGFIYYHDTTYSFSKLKFQQTSGTDLMTYDSLAVRTILAGDNITFTHSNNVLTIKATDTTYSTATNSALGLVKVGDTINDTTGYTAVYINNGKIYYKDTNTTYSTATSSALGLVKVGDAISDVTGYTACKIKDGVIYYKDTNTTYIFYNLQFQNSEGTTVDTYKPTTSPTKTLKAGNNVTISAASNVITIASINTWNANAVGVAGYVAAPTKAANANMTWLTDANGNPAWRASNNHSHSYLPLSGGAMNAGAMIYWTDWGQWGASNPTYPKAQGGLQWNGTSDLIKLFAEEVASDDLRLVLLFGDDTSPRFEIRNKDGNATAYISNSGAADFTSLSVSGTNVSLNGHKHSYTDLTGSGTTTNQAIVSNGTTNGWTLKTLGSNAFSSTAYLPLTGGTLSGEVNVKNTTLERGKTPTNRTSLGRWWLDKNSKPLGGIEFVSETNGRNFTGLWVLTNTNESTANEYGGIYAYKTLGVSGNKYAIFNANTGEFSADTFIGSLTGHASLDLALTGGVMSGCITTKTGESHNGIKLGNTYLTSINGEVIFLNNTAIRFGGDSWDWNVWAALGYDSTNKIIHLGLAAIPYSANSQQSGGKIYTQGIDDIYIGNGTYKVWHAGNFTPGNINIVDKSTHASSESFYIPMINVTTGNTTVYGSDDFYIYRNNNSNYLNIGKAGINSGITFRNIDDINGGYGNLVSTACTAYREWKLPDKAGTIALTSDFYNKIDSDSRYVNVTGDEMSGSLSIKSSLFDLSKYNNDLPEGSDVIWPGFFIKDKNGRLSVQYINGVYNNGVNRMFLTVRNFDSSGNLIANKGLGLSVNKSGEGTWWVSEGTSFRNAIGAAATNHTHSSITVTNKSTHSSAGETFYIPMISTYDGNATVYGSQDFYMWRGADSNYLNIGKSGITSGITFHRVGEAEGKYGNLVSAICTDIRTWTLPDKTGTLAITSDLNNYLPLTGGILTDTKRLLLTLHQNTEGDGPYIAFRLNGSDVGYFGYNVSSGFFMQSVAASKTLRIYTNGTLQFGGNKVLDASNTYVNANGVGYIDSKPITKLSDTITRKFWNLTYWDNGLPVSNDITGALLGSGTITIKNSGTTESKFIAINGTGLVELLAAGTNRGVYDRDGNSWIVGTGPASTNPHTFLMRGNIGIGTTTPSCKLHVVGTSGTDAARLTANGSADPLVLDASRGYNVIRYLMNGSFKWSVGCNTDGFYWWSGGISSTVFTILNGGNVGIGTTSPSTKLDVNGLLKANYYKASWSATGTNGSSGYVNIANITVTGSYANTPLKFRVVQRGQTNGGEITIRFTNASSAANTKIAQFFCYGDIPTAFITQSGTIFSLYILKAEAYDTICITGIDFGSSYLSVEWKNGFTTSIPSGAIIAEHFFLIGNNRIIYDSASSALKVVHKNGSSAANLYATNFYTTSDRNKKLNITVFSEHIRKFLLKGTEKYAYGVIAQEVEEMFRSGKEGEMNVNYNSVLSFYVGQLENRVKELEEKIRLLETK